MSHIEERIIQYFEGELSLSEENILRSEIAQSAEFESMFAEYSTLYTSMDEAPLHYPSERMQHRFDQLILKQNKESANVDANAQKRRGVDRVFTLRQIMSVAAVGLLLCCICYLVKLNLDKNMTVSSMNSELMSMRMTMEELLQNESTTSRIRAVNMSYDLSRPDRDVLHVLCSTMQEDKSANVRLAAATALGQYAEEAEVKRSLIDALRIENDPVVQIELINILSSIKEQEALPGFDDLLENQNLLQSVKDELHLGKIKIESI